MDKLELMRNFLKRHVFYLLGLTCLFIVGIIYLTATPQVHVNENMPVFVPAAERVDFDHTAAPAATPEPAPKNIVVHIVGAVNNPGVYVLQEGARINDVLALAGGAAENADLRRVNLAAFAVDAMQIVIPFYGEDVGEVFVFSGDASTPAAGSGTVNINTATSQELQTLPGIGPVLSESIIVFRETHGRFRYVDELLNVSGIGPATLERLRPLVDVR